MQGRRDPSFFPTKKNPAPAGEEEGRMNLDARESEIYFSIASLSGTESEYNLPLGGDLPGSKSMAQS